MFLPPNIHFLYTLILFIRSPIYSVKHKCLIYFIRLFSENGGFTHPFMPFPILTYLFTLGPFNLFWFTHPFMSFPKNGLIYSSIYSLYRICIVCGGCVLTSACKAKIGFWQSYDKDKYRVPLMMMPSLKNTQTASFFPFSTKSVQLLHLNKIWSTCRWLVFRRQLNAKKKQKKPHPFILRY